MRNVELLERTMTQIKDYPELHDQGTLFVRSECGTAACFAGWACLLSGCTPAFLPETVGALSTFVLDRDARLQSAWDQAVRLLNITGDEARILFHPCNSRAMLELMVKDLVNGENLKRPVTYREELEQQA